MTTAFVVELPQNGHSPQDNSEDMSKLLVGAAAVVYWVQPQVLLPNINQNNHVDFRVFVQHNISKY